MSGHEPGSLLGGLFRARRATEGDRRALADHETLIALHEMAKQQLDILQNQEQVLDILDNFASKDMPGRQQQLLDTVHQIPCLKATTSATT